MTVTAKKRLVLAVFIVSNTYMFFHLGGLQIDTTNWIALTITSAGMIGGVIGMVIGYPINWILGLAWFLLNRKQRRAEISQAKIDLVQLVKNTSGKAE